MWNLLTELSLLFLIAILIGWLMGRYLCKSGEIDERNQKESFLKEKTHLATTLQQRDGEYQKALQKINTNEKLIAEHEQKISSLHGQLDALSNEKEKLLENLQELSQVETLLKALTEDHQHEQKQHRRYRNKSIELTDQRDNLINVRNTLNDKLNTAESQLQSKIFELENMSTRTKEQKSTIKRLEHEKDDLIQAVKLDKAQLTQELEREKDKAILRLETERDKEIQRLKIARDKTIHELITEHDVTLQKLEKEKKATLHKLSSLQESQTMLLEKTKDDQQFIKNENDNLKSENKLIQNEKDSLKLRLKTQEKDYGLLQEKCTILTEESLKFGRKFEEINKEKNELRQSIEAITIENNDYIGRLRAISSVVDVVGTEPNRIISLNSDNN